MKHILNIVFIIAFAITTFAQNIDDERMHRDLQVAENALGTIITPNEGDFPRWDFDEKNIEAGFVKDYGVIFMVNGSNFGNIRLLGKVKSKDKSKTKKGKGKTDEGKKENFIESSKMFLADYAGIIGQLKEDQRISIRKGGSNSHGSNYGLEEVYFANGESSNNLVYWNSNKSDDSELIIEAKVGDINALRKGSMSRDAFLKSITVIENIRSYEKDADLETLTAMFHRLYKKDLSKSYYSDRKPKYSKLTNFGIIVKMKVYSSYEDNAVYSMPTISKEGLSLIERNNMVMELLPRFEADFKDNLVNYGRTLKNLESDDVLLFEVDMTICKDCKDFPRIMKFSIKKSVLHQYNRGDLSMKQAIDKVNVERI